jgi:hypothetical protein
MTSDTSANDAYFVMTCEGIAPAAAVQLVTEWNSAPWMTGEVLRRAVANPVVFRTNPAYPGTLKPMYEGTILLMRDDLLQRLLSAGVDNLQTFPAVIRDEEGKLEHKNYKAVNIVGLVSCANMAESERMDPEDDTELIDVDFESLVIDESKTGGALLFRLAEAASAIIVHRSVRAGVEGAVPGMTFYASGEWSG